MFEFMEFWAQRTVSPADGREGWTVVDGGYVEHLRAGEYLRTLVDGSGRSVGTARTYARRLALYLTWAPSAGCEESSPDVQSLAGLGSRRCLAAPFSIAHHHRRHPHGGGGLRRILGLSWPGRRWCRPGSDREEGAAVPAAGLRSRRAAWAAGRAETTGPSPSGGATAGHLDP